MNNNEITLKIFLSTGLDFSIKCKIEEKLSDVVDRFKQTNNIEYDLNFALSGGKEIDIDKTILELNFIDNQAILFIVQQNIDEDIKEVKKKYELKEDEIKQIKKWIIEYKYNHILNIDNNGKLENFEDKKLEDSKKLEYIRKQEKRCFIIIKEHPHKLIYCISLLNWDCSLCKEKFKKEDAKYYCSLCDFNMCDKCHSKTNCTKKKAFPEGIIKPSNSNINNQFLDTKHHKLHKLFYCRTSRSVIGYSKWMCNNCNKTFKNDIWSFYCTQCDFDLCSVCAGFM